eukprot:755889-Hanusia_phi.AAC.11
MKTIENVRESMSNIDCGQTRELRKQPKVPAVGGAKEREGIGYNAMVLVQGGRYGDPPELAKRCCGRVNANNPFSDDDTIARETFCDVRFDRRESAKTPDQVHCLLTGKVFCKSCARFKVSIPELEDDPEATTKKIVPASFDAYLERTSIAAGEEGCCYLRRSSPPRSGLIRYKSDKPPAADDGLNRVVMPAAQEEEEDDDESKNIINRPNITHPEQSESEKPANEASYAMLLRSSSHHREALLDGLHVVVCPPARLAALEQPLLQEVLRALERQAEGDKRLRLHNSFPSLGRPSQRERSRIDGSKEDAKREESSKIRREEGRTDKYATSRLSWLLGNPSESDQTLCLSHQRDKPIKKRFVSAFSMALSRSWIVISTGTILPSCKPSANVSISLNPPAKKVSHLDVLLDQCGML